MHKKTSLKRAEPNEQKKEAQHSIAYKTMANEAKNGLPLDNEIEKCARETKIRPKLK